MITDANGKHWQMPSNAATMYGLVLQARPLWKRYQAALVSAALPADCWSTPHGELGGLLDDTLAEQMRTATKAEKKAATQRAVGWDRNPMLQKTLALLLQRAMVQPAIMAKEAWFEQIQDDRLFARKHKEPGDAHDATKTYGKAAGYLEKEQTQPQGNTFNFNGPALFAGWTSEELTAYIAKERAAIAEGKVVGNG